MCSNRRGVPLAPTHGIFSCFFVFVLIWMGIFFWETWVHRDNGILSEESLEFSWSKVCYNFWFTFQISWLFWQFRENGEILMVQKKQWNFDGSKKMVKFWWFKILLKIIFRNLFNSSESRIFAQTKERKFSFSSFSNFPKLFLLFFFCSGRCGYF